MSSAALITAPYVRTAHAAGKLTMGFWDHWVPGANKASTDLVNEWAAKEKVEVSIDYITEPGQQEPADHRRRSARRNPAMTSLRCRHGGPTPTPTLLEPVNDIMEAADQAERRGQRHGASISARPDGKWLGVPACIGSQIKGPCSRIDLMKKYAGIDVQEMYPAGSPPEGGRLDHGHIPEGGRGLPQGRLSLRHRTR